jgi:hypothetical protein
MMNMRQRLFKGIEYRAWYLPRTPGITVLGVSAGSIMAALDVISGTTGNTKI